MKTASKKSMWRNLIGVSEDNEEETTVDNSKNVEQSNENDSSFGSWLGLGGKGKQVMQQPTSNDDLFRVKSRSSAVSYDGEDMQIWKPTAYKQVQEIANSIINRKSIILNMNLMTNEEEAQRLVEFISGVCYPFGITLQDVDAGIWAVEHTKKNISDI